jgi:DNA-binding NarL/FixJ family response regulator
MIPPPQLDQGEERRRVALVHHNALLREGLSRILDSGGFQIVWQGNSGAGMIGHVADASPDVVLLEWEAPGVDASLIQDVSASSLDASIVIMTRPDTDEDLTAVLEAGAAGCLSVNLDAHDFLAALRLLAQGDILVSHEMVPALTSTAGDGDRLEDRLTPRELEVLRALGKGATNQEIADQLFLSPHTVKIHVRRILAKMEFRNRQQAAAYAAAKGLV